jgi:putative ABC transport system substrate-binding protein
MDIDSIPVGVDFVEFLESWVDRCDIMLALIGAGWADGIDPKTGRRRLENPDDFVRIEVRKGLTRGIPVVPILLDGAEPPDAAQLPDDLRRLIRRNAEFIDHRTVDTDVDRLIRRLRLTEQPAQAAPKRATSAIPIVFLYGGDPVKDGLVASFNRPGGNLTGMIALTGELLGKRLDLLLQMIPRARKVGFLSGTRNFIAYEDQTSAILAAGRAGGVEIMVVECRDDREYESALVKMVDGGADAMILGAFALPNLEKVVPLAARYKLPTIYPSRFFPAVIGGLMSYDADNPDLLRRLGSAYVARILKGAAPADLPVEQPTKFELVINLKTAKALGHTIPETLLATADEVIQ